MTVPALHSSTINVTNHLSLVQLRGSNIVTGVQIIWTIVMLTDAHSISGPVRRIDHLSKATMVRVPSLQGQTVMVASRAKTVVNDSQGTAFGVAILATEH